MIAQDNEQLMYFANTDGLLQYDGTNWNIYPLPDKQIIRSVAIDDQNRIFTGAYGEFGYWIKEESGALRYTSLSETVDFNLVKKEEIWNIVVHQGFVLFQSFSTIYKFDYQNIQIAPAPDFSTIMFVHEVEDKLYVQAKGLGLFELSKELAFQFIEGSEFLANMEVSGVMGYKDKGLLISTSHQGVFAYLQGKFTPWQNEADLSFRQYQLNKMIRLFDGNYAFGTILNGFYLLNPEGKIIWKINQKQGLQNNTILAMREDAQHNLWLGLDEGIDLVELNSELTYYQDFDGLLGTVYTAVLANQYLYVGTNHGVYYRPWRTESINKPPFQLIPGSQGQVWELKQRGEDILCGHNQGTFKINNTNWEKISPITGGWISLMFPDRDDLLVQGTYNGLVVYKKTNHSGWAFSHRIEGFREPIKQLAFDLEGNIFVANPYRGLLKLKLSEDFRKILHIREYDLSDGLETEFNIGLVKLQDQILIRSGDIFLRYESGTDKFVPEKTIIPASKGSNNYRIQKGDQQRYFRIYPNQVDIVSDTSVKKLPISLVSGYENIVQLDSSHYLFCLNSGYALYKENIQIKRTKTQSPQVQISQVCLSGEADSSHCLNFRTIGNVPISLAHNQNNLRFAFSIPNYTHYPKFRYQLEGFSNFMSEWTEQNFKEFTNLNPGEYVFRVFSDLGEQAAEVSFIITPPWYKTLWMQVIWFILSLACIFFLTKFQAARLEKKRRQEELKRQQELKRQLMEARNEKLQLDVLSKSTELANSTMNLIRKNEILLILKEELKKIRLELNQGLPYKYYKRVLRIIDGNISTEYDLQVFETNFNQVHEQFFKRLKSDYPDLTSGDLQLAAFLRMNLSSKEIAPILNISLRGVENKRYRLRKKMNLSPEENLTSHLIEY